MAFNFPPWSGPVSGGWFRSESALNDPLSGFRYIVSMYGIGEGPQAGFKEVSGISTSAAPVPYRLSGMGMTHGSRSRPGLIKQGDVTFRRGHVLGSMSMSHWFGLINPDGAPNFETRDEDPRRTIDISVYRGRGGLRTATLKWRLHEAYPINYVPFDTLDSMDSSIILESMTLKCENIEYLIAAG